jgi:hypothetical protein
VREAGKRPPRDVFVPNQYEGWWDMSFFCRFGLHRWSFNTQLLDEPGHSVHTELISARCRREGCIRYGAWSVIHREARGAGAPGHDSQMRPA